MDDFFRLLRNCDEAGLKTYLDRTNTKPSDYVTETGCTALHVVAIDAPLRVVYRLLEEMKSRCGEGELKQTLKDWVGVRNREGLTCMQYACYNGRLDIARIYTQLGSDLVSSLHYTALGDQALLLCYLCEMGVPLHTTNTNLENPLHSAVKEAADFVANVILALDKEGKLINARNSLGQTSLILAAMHNSRKSVRLLLLRGADSSLKVTFI